MTGLPTGWRTAPLGDLGVEVREAVQPEPEVLYDLYSVPAFPTGQPETIYGRDIGSAKRAVAPNDVLLCKINPRINRVWIVGPYGGRQQIASPEYLILRTSDSQLARYLRLYLSSPDFRDWITLSVEGATGSHTRAKSGPILRWLVPIPPLAEQRRLVATIEEHLFRLDAAEVSLRAASARTKVMVRGATARALAGDWPLTQLREITAKQEYGSSAKAEREGDVPVLRMGNLRDGDIDLGDLKFLPAEHPDATRFRLVPGDLLFNRTNSPELVGKSAVFRGADGPVAFASYLIRVQLTEDCLPEWAALVINSPRGRAYIAGVRTQQVGQANVNGTKLAAMPIPLPPVETQRRLLAEVDAYRPRARQLRFAVKVASARSDSLSRSILVRAFRGELVLQDPNDEPATVLLEQIAAKRAAAPKPARTVQGRLTA